LLNSRIDEFTDYVAEQCCVGLAEFLDVKLIAIERLDLFVILLSYNFAKLMQEDVLGLGDILSLHSDKLRNCNSLVTFLG
jgi:hypothetical protein